MSRIPAVPTEMSVSSSLSFIEGESSASDLHGFWVREVHRAERSLSPGPRKLSGANWIPNAMRGVMVGQSGVNPECEIDEGVEGSG